MTPIWITGPTASGKTTRLAYYFRRWVEAQFRRHASEPHRPPEPPQAPAVLVLAANEATRRRLSDRFAAEVRGRYPVLAKTPLGFFAEEVELFWPLLFQRLQLRAQFPLRLRPETEQELATRLWHDRWEESEIPSRGSEARLVRSTLDLMQLAGASGIDSGDIPAMLAAGLGAGGMALLPDLQPGPDLWQRLGDRLQEWRQWCLERGLLTYGLIYELYGRELLSDATYRTQLQRRYRAAFADDTDDYPAIARDLLDVLLDGAAVGAIAFNPDGQVRLGLGADPAYLAGLAARCQVKALEPTAPGAELHPQALSETVVPLALDPLYYSEERLPDAIQGLQTLSRAALLRQTGEAIADTIRSGAVRPGEVAVIAPGLDEIARYTLMSILQGRQIAVRPLNEQRPLASSPLVRGLLALLALVYPGMGRIVTRDAVAEMLAVLSGPAIDPVRAGLLADYCFVPDPDEPYLQAAEAFPRWDRLGDRATTAYTRILDWIAARRDSEREAAIPNAILLLDRAIQTFYDGGRDLPGDRLAVLRELMETAQHFWEVDRRLRQHDLSPQTPLAAILQFVQLVRQGTIAANPYPARLTTAAEDAVTLATIFQYRSDRRQHRWQFWLDAGSPLWLKGGAAELFGAPLFLRDWSGRAVGAADQLAADEARLQRILRDLLGRARDHVILCHSDLAASGAEQTGPLLTLVHAASEYRAIAPPTETVPPT